MVFQTKKYSLKALSTFNSCLHYLEREEDRENERIYLYFAGQCRKVCIPVSYLHAKPKLSTHDYSTAVKVHGIGWYFTLILHAHLHVCVCIYVLSASACIGNPFNVVTFNFSPFTRYTFDYLVCMWVFERTEKKLYIAERGKMLASFFSCT